jgi:hypothetical protein
MTHLFFQTKPILENSNSSDLDGESLEEEQEEDESGNRSDLSGDVHDAEDDQSADVSSSLEDERAGEEEEKGEEEPNGAEWHEAEQEDEEQDGAGTMMAQEKARDEIEHDDFAMLRRARRRLPVSLERKNSNAITTDSHNSQSQPQSRPPPPPPVAVLPPNMRRVSLPFRPKSNPSSPSSMTPKPSTSSATTFFGAPKAPAPETPIPANILPLVTTPKQSIPPQDIHKTAEQGGAKPADAVAFWVHPFQKQKLLPVDQVSLFPNAIPVYRGSNNGLYMLQWDPKRNGNVIVYLNAKQKGEYIKQIRQHAHKKSNYR